MVNWMVGAGARMVQKGAACHYICMKRPLLIRVPARSPPWLMHAGVMCKQNHAKRGAGARRQADMGPLAGWKVAGLGNITWRVREGWRSVRRHTMRPAATIQSRRRGFQGGRRWAPCEDAQQEVVSLGGYSDQNAHAGDRCIRLGPLSATRRKFLVPPFLHLCSHLIHTLD